MASFSGEDERLNALIGRIAAAECRLDALEQKYQDPVERVKRALLAMKIFSAKFETVHSAYYDLSLEQRAELLQCSVPQLCKSIIFENKEHDPTVVDSYSNSKYYCVITQYTGKTAYMLDTCPNTI